MKTGQYVTLLKTANFDAMNIKCFTVNEARKLIITRKKAKWKCHDLTDLVTAQFARTTFFIYYIHTIGPKQNQISLLLKELSDQHSHSIPFLYFILHT